MYKYLAPLLLLVLPAFLFAQDNPANDQESTYYQIQTLTSPDGVVLEVGGLAYLPDGKLAVSTRRGEIWIVENWNTETPKMKRFASGLHEPLGLAWHEGSLYTTQRSEITKLTDKNGDGRADRYETIVSWPLTANYHEYSYGPEFLPNGNMLITLNVGWEGKGVSKSPFRGWMLQVTPEGEILPYAAGMRSPAGFGFHLDGDIFYAENQGDWVGSGRMTHLEKGDFAGHPASLAWADEPGSEVPVKREEIHDDYRTMYEAAKTVKGLKLPAVWFPHSIMGISTSDIQAFPEEGFGPFGGQLMVGDQGQSKIMRVFLEKVNGEYQGACFPFREGFGSGILRIEPAPDGSMMVGMTSRGWASTGSEPFGLQRLVYTGKTPFEVQKMEAQEDGFLLTFTQKVTAKTAANPASYSMQRFTYLYREAYGSPVQDLSPCRIISAEVLPSGNQVKLKVSGLALGYIHEIRLSGVTNTDGEALLHDFGYYTLNAMPGTHNMADMAAPVDLANTAPSFDAKKHITTMPAAWGGKATATLEIQTQPGLKYNKTELTVKAGSRVSLRFVNPDDMQHNFVITKAGQSQAVGQAALQMGLAGPGNHYIPTNSNILFHSSLLEPGTEETIYFVAPTQPGRYDYVCTVPGHATVMRGVLVVE
ncbi:MAG: plastocyanin/azurin family copper-binding protein [Bacteroidia bacterium]|nr:plastocyanin/azurin family copper-binding protein [Bacteroidia bacterium]